MERNCASISWMSTLNLRHQDTNKKWSYTWSELGAKLVQAYKYTLVFEVYECTLRAESSYLMNYHSAVPHRFDNIQTVQLPIESMPCSRPSPYSCLFPQLHGRKGGDWTFYITSSLRVQFLIHLLPGEFLNTVRYALNFFLTILFRILYLHIPFLLKISI